jgi:dihydrofolate reductase
MSRKIVAHLAMSADGFIARPDGAIDWLDRPRPKGDYGMGEFFRSVDTILWGRKTYEMALAYKQQGKMSAPFDPKLKHYVFTRTLRRSEAASGVEFVDEPVKPFAQRLRGCTGKNIWMMGGAGIIASFLDEGEMDEFEINMIPVFIGEGIPLIAPRHRNVLLELVSSRSFPDGVVGLHYAVRK